MEALRCSGCIHPRPERVCSSPCSKVKELSFVFTSETICGLEAMVATAAPTASSEPPSPAVAAEGLLRGIY